MAVEIKKEVTVTMSGEHIHDLRNACECARIYLESHHWRPSSSSGAGQYLPVETRRLYDFITQIFDETSSRP